MADTNSTAAPLVPEILAHMTVQRAPRVGDLVVVTDYAGREIGGRLERVLGDGDAIVRVCGLTSQPPYRNGDAISRPMSDIRRAA